MTPLLAAALANSKLHDQLVVPPIVAHDPVFCFADAWNPTAWYNLRAGSCVSVTPNLIVVI
jgi:hypothetical protein